jgi:hypothetical protein
VPARAWRFKSSLAHQDKPPDSTKRAGVLFYIPFCKCSSVPCIIAAMTLLHEPYKVLGVLSIAYAWIGTGMLLVFGPRMPDHSISRHAALSRAAFWWMVFVEALSLPMFVVFVVRWLTPTFQLGLLFDLATFYSAAALLIASWIPATTGLQNRIHELLAYSGAFVFMIPIAMIAGRGGTTIFSRGIAALTLGYMSYSIWLFACRPEAKKHHLEYQSLYLILFDITILSLTYLH